MSFLEYGRTEQAILEVEIYKLLDRAMKVKLSVLVDYMVEKGFKKVEVYNLVKWKLTSPLLHPKDSKVWAPPMVIVQDEFNSGKVTKMVTLEQEWRGIEVEEVYKFFTGTLSHNLTFW